jgi:hypothetical protein
VALTTSRSRWRGTKRSGRLTVRNPHLKRILVLSSTWFLIISVPGNFVSILFIYQLGNFLDASPSESNRFRLIHLEPSLQERFDMTFYLIFSYFLLVLLVTLGCHRYLKAWLRTIYGLPIPSALIES